MVPPTYAFSREVDERVRKVMAAASRPSRFGFKGDPSPQDIGARSGLTLYGRNNIAYVRKKGSFLRLTAFYRDLACENDPWEDKRMLPACKTCRACLKACPNGVITEDRFLIRVERCLTFLNEQPAEKAFPDSGGPETHNAMSVACIANGHAHTTRL